MKKVDKKKIEELRKVKIKKLEGKETVNKR